jgi:RNA:NAD 2'-phosphotransferase (TPT1/KptA family)
LYQAVEDEGLLKKATNPSELPICLHGTNKDAWEPIRKEGLKSMTRNHMRIFGI